MRLGSEDRLPVFKFKFSLCLTSFVIWNNTLNLSVLTFLSCKITNELYVLHKMNGTIQ